MKLKRQMSRPCRLSHILKEPLDSFLAVNVRDTVNQISSSVNCQFEMTLLTTRYTSTVTTA